MEICSSDPSESSMFIAIFEKHGLICKLLPYKVGTPTEGKAVGRGRKVEN